MARRKKKHSPVSTTSERTGKRPLARKKTSSSITTSFVPPKSSLSQKTLNFLRLPWGKRFSGFFLSNPIGVFLILAAAIILVYSNTFTGEFHFDDYNILIDNDSQLIDSLTDIPLTNRVVVFFSFALNYAVHGLDVFGYHIVNTFVHIFASVLVWFIVLKTTQTPFMKKTPLAEHRYILALFAALFFAVHPLQTQAVTYIVQRFASMATLWYLATLALYIQGRFLIAEQKKLPAGGMFLGAGITALLAFFSKEVTFTLPAALFLYEYAFFSKLTKKTLLVGIPLLAIIFGGMAFFALQHDIGVIFSDTLTFDYIPISWNEYFFTQWSVVLHYFRLVLIPFGQNLDYDYLLISSPFHPLALVSLGTLLLILAWAVMLWRRQQRFLAFGILWVFLTLSIESSIFPLADLVMEHRMYLPFLGVAMVVVGSLLSLPAFSTPKGRHYVIASLIGAIVIFGSITYTRNAVWQTDISLWTDVIRKSPNKIRPYLQRARAYGMLPDGKEAMDQDKQRASEFTEELIRRREALEVERLNPHYQKKLKEVERKLNTQSATGGA